MAFWFKAHQKHSLTFKEIQQNSKIETASQMIGILCYYLISMNFAIQIPTQYNHLIDLKCYHLLEHKKHLNWKIYKIQSSVPFYEVWTYF